MHYPRLGIILAMVAGVAVYRMAGDDGDMRSRFG
jgi:hypothetical protein